MATIDITHETGASKGRYVGRITGVEGEAELTYSRASPTLVVADHTFAPDIMRGTGAAKALVDRLITDARSGGYKIFPTCSYVVAQFGKHPEWADVLSK
jgi:predicted GNAT family acetyltransferase